MVFLGCRRDKGVVFEEVYAFYCYGFSRYSFRGCLEAAWKKPDVLPYQNRIA